MSKKQKQNQRGWFAGFPGLAPLIHRFVYGGTSTPKLRKPAGSVTPNPNADGNTNYDVMKPEAYRWFREDELVRRCIIVNASYAVMAAGFETELEPLEKLSEKDLAAFQEKYQFVKEYVDAANRVVNMDRILFVAQVKRCIFGKAGFEILFEDDKPSWLLSVDSRRISAAINGDWQFLGVKYNDALKWPVDEENFLFFTNLALENDCEGLSDVEPVYLVCKARHNLLKRDLPEITRSLWAPYAVLSADTSGMTGAAEDAFLDSLIDAAKSGKSIAVNKQVSATVVDHKINLTGLVALLEKLEEALIRNFGTPRFLVNKGEINRATAYAEFEAYVGGTLNSIQRYFRRELEAQWYPMLVKRALKQMGEAGVVPLRVKHVWNSMRTTDTVEMANAVSQLYSNGLGLLADEPEIAYDMMGWPTDKLVERQKQLQVNPAQPEPKNQQQKQEEDLPGDEQVNDGEET